VTRRVEIPATLAARARDHLAVAAPEEGCGLLSGIADARSAAVAIAGVHPAPNVAAGDRRVAYRVDPRVHLELQRRLRGTGLAVVGSFHSHPLGPSGPSPRDLSEALPGFLYVIDAPGEALRAFVLREDGAAFDEVPIAVAPEPPAPAGADRVLDLRGEVCPFTTIRARLALDEADDGATLAIVLDHPPAFESVPRNLDDAGHDVLRVERSGRDALVVVRRGDSPRSR